MTPSKYPPPWEQEGCSSLIPSNLHISDSLEAIIVSLIGARRVDKAESVLYKNLKDSSFQDDSLWIMSNLFHKECKYNISIILLESISPKFRNVEYYTLKAKCYKCLRITLQGNPGSQNFHFALEKAICAAKDALNIDNKDPESYLLLAQLYFYAHQYDKAIASCKAGLNLENCFEFRKLLIESYLILKDFHSAGEEIESLASMTLALKKTDWLSLKDLQLDHAFLTRNISKVLECCDSLITDQCHIFKFLIQGESKFSEAIIQELFIYTKEYTISTSADNYYELNLKKITDINRKKEIVRLIKNSNVDNFFATNQPRNYIAMITSSRINQTFKKMSVANMNSNFRPLEFLTCLAYEIGHSRSHVMFSIQNMMTQLQHEELYLTCGPTCDFCDFAMKKNGFKKFRHVDSFNILLDKEFGSCSHRFLEVYCDDLKKWVAVDPDLRSIFFTNNRKVPASVIEIIESRKVSRKNLSNNTAETSVYQNNNVIDKQNDLHLFNNLEKFYNATQQCIGFVTSEESFYCYPPNFSVEEVNARAKSVLKKRLEKSIHFISIDQFKNKFYG